jgi:hypothetical protein
MGWIVPLKIGAMRENAQTLGTFEDLVVETHYFSMGILMLCCLAALTAIS